MKKKNVSYEDSLRHNKEAKRRRIYGAYAKKTYFFKLFPIVLSILFFKNIIISFLFSAIWYIFHTVFFDRLDIYPFKPSVSVWFGVPGSGKTSMAALLSRASQKFDYKVLSNFELQGAYKVSSEDLGKYDMSFGGDGCHVLLDEGQLDFDNRNYMNFARGNGPKYFSLHRHMVNRVDVFSQGYDIDKRIRDRTSNAGLFHLRRFPIKGFVYYRHIKKVFIINKEDKQMIDGFSYMGLPRIIYSKSVWNSFDTLDMSMCPQEQKEWELWNIPQD